MFKKILYSLLVIPVVGFLLYLYIHNKSNRDAPPDFVTLAPAGWQHLLLFDNGHFDDQKCLTNSRQRIQKPGISFDENTLFNLSSHLPVASLAIGLYPEHSVVFIFQLTGKNKLASLTPSFAECGFSVTGAGAQSAELKGKNGSLFAGISRGVLVMGTTKKLAEETLQRLDESPSAFALKEKNLLSSVPGDYTFTHLSTGPENDTLVEKIFSEPHTEKSIGYVFGETKNSATSSGVTITLLSSLPLSVQEASGKCFEKKSATAGVTEACRFFFPGFATPAYLFALSGDSLSPDALASLVRHSWGDTLKPKYTVVTKNPALLVATCDSAQLQLIDLQFRENLQVRNDSALSRVEPGEGHFWNWEVRKEQGEKLVATLRVHSLQNNMPGLRTTKVTTCAYNRLLPLLSPVITTDTLQSAVMTDSSSEAVFAAAVSGKVLAFAASGKKIWEKNLHGKLLSKLWLIRSKSDRVRILCNTSDSIFGITPKGENAKGFPVRIPGGTDFPIQVLSNHKEIDYRISTAGRKGKIFLIKSNGKQLKDFEPEEKILAASSVFGLLEKDNKNYYFLDKKSALVTMTGKGKVQHTDSTLQLENRVCFVMEKTDDTHLQLVSADNQGNLIAESRPGQSKQVCKSGMKGITSAHDAGNGRFVVSVGSAVYLLNKEGKIEARNMRGHSFTQVYAPYAGGAFTWFDGSKTLLYNKDRKVLSVIHGSSMAVLLQQGKGKRLWMLGGRVLAEYY